MDGLAHRVQVDRYTIAGRTPHTAVVTMAVRALAVIVVALSCVLPAVASAASIGVAGSTTVVRPNDAAPATSSADITALQNEFESFQVVVAAGATAVQTLDFLPPTPLAGANGTSIPASAITVYREAYYNVATESDGELSSSKGRYPDALIPDVDPWFGENRNAFPTSVPALENRAAWIDVQVPMSQAPGTYSGVIRAVVNGVTTNIPVTVRVIGTALPSTSSLRGAFDINTNVPCRVHGCSTSTDGWQLMALYSRVALDNRVTLAKPAYSTPSSTASQTEFRNWVTPLFTGTAATRLSGAKLTDTVIYGWCATCVGAWKLEAQRAGFANKIVFHCDEVGKSVAMWQSCRDTYNTASTQWNSTGTAAGTLPLQATTTVNELDWANSYADSSGARPLSGIASSVSTLVPVVNRLHDKSGEFAGDQRAKYSAFSARRAGNKVWSYQSCMSHGCVDDEYRLSSYWSGWPSYAIDQPASEARAMPWLLFDRNVGGEYYYETAKNLDTAWSNQYSEGGNGDGTLFYPGLPNGGAGIPAIGGTRHIPIESIRLKRIRDGREDYEYLSILEKNGLRTEAVNVVRSVFPTPYSTSVSQSQINTARGSLQTMVKSLTQTQVAPAPISPPPTAVEPAPVSPPPAPTPDSPYDAAPTPPPAPAPAVLYCKGKVATIVGTERTDWLIGTSRNDVIVAKGGNDFISTGGGNDTICAGGGNDNVYAGSGNDLVFGSTGNDILRAGRGIDNLRGGDGRDRLFGDALDIMLGNGGADYLVRT